MKTNNSHWQKSLIAAIAVLLAMSMAPGQLLAAGTAAGERIQNQATATYVDANQNAQSAQSNIATIVVGQVYSATLGEDRVRFASSGQSVNFAHILANTGNGTDTYTISLAQGISSGDDLDFDNLAIYIDQNGDGVATAGETLVAAAGGFGTITLGADSQVDLVVLGRLPATGPNQTMGATVTVTSANGTVDDLTSGKGVDGLDETNEDLATSTDLAVLNVNKSSMYNDQGTDAIADDTVTFVVTLTNTGPVAAYNVEIQDALDLSVFNVTAIGQITINATDGNFMDTAANPDEGSIGSDTIEGFAPIAVNDANHDLAVGDFGVRGHDDVLHPDETISFSYTVHIKPDLPAGTLLQNSVNILGDVNDDGDTGDSGEKVTSNTTTQKVPQEYGVDASDTGAGADGAANDGGDDDGAINDVQQVNTAASGSQVLFDNKITNNGNGADTFELSVADPIAPTNPFPAGTVFSFWQANGSGALLDTNNNGSVDTGPLDPGETLFIVVKAQLPAGAYAAIPSTAILTAKSAGKPTVLDTKTEYLLAIQAPGVDLSNAPARGVDSSDGNPALNKHSYSVGGTTPTTTYTPAPGQSFDIPLTIENNSGVPDAFQVSAGMTWNGAVMGGFASGWTYVFKDESENTITTTPAVPPGGVFLFHLKVYVPSNPVKALANFTSDFDGDAVEETVNANDTDGDYPIFIRVASTNTGASDVKMDAADVTDSERVTLLANQTGQIQPGGSIGYPHTLRNDGNTVEAFRLTAENSLAAAGWGNNILVDTTGNGIGDTLFSTLVNFTTTVYYTAADGTYKTQVFGADVLNHLVLQPGERLDVTVLEFAPSSAPDGTLDILTVRALYNAGGSQVINVDQTTVIQGQIRLVKTVAIDADCGGVADEAFATTAASKAKPGECVSWRLTVTNDGTAIAKNVIIHDTIPAYSDYVADSLQSGAGKGGLTAVPAVVLSPNTDADDAEVHPNGYTAKIVGKDITYNLGDMAPGNAVTLQFQTSVQ